MLVVATIIMLASAIVLAYVLLTDRKALTNHWGDWLGWW